MSHEYELISVESLCDVLGVRRVSAFIQFKDVFYYVANQPLVRGEGGHHSHHTRPPNKATLHKKCSV